MNFIDIIIVVSLIYAGWRGYKKGLIREVFTLLALLLGIYAGIHFSDWITGIIQSKMSENAQYLPVISFTVIFILVGITVFFIGKLIEKIVKTIKLGIVNKIIGLILGIAKVAVILSLIIVIIETFDERGDFVPPKIKTESALYLPAKDFAITVFPFIKESSIWLKSNIEAFN